MVVKLCNDGGSHSSTHAVPSFDDAKLSVLFPFAKQKTEKIMRKFDFFSFCGKSAHFARNRCYSMFPYGEHKRKCGGNITGALCEHDGLFC